MALTQTALRVPGPSWDEEVVPALRKRLQSESRTLSKRMSAISLSGDEVVGVGGTFTPYNGTEAPSTRQKTSTTTTAQTKYQHRQPSGKNSLDYPSGSRLAAGATGSNYPNTAHTLTATITTTTASHHPNGSTSTSTSFQRSRTYSQPDSAAKMSSSARSANGSARPSDPKPTRIPKPSRAYTNYSNGNTPVVPQSNGFASSSPPHEQYDFGGYNNYDGRGGTVSSHLTTSSTSKSIQGLAESRSASGLLNESPPFPPTSSTTSLAYSPSMNGHYDPGRQKGGEAWMDAAPSRQSMESEEQPFEHWYRGEVSRNGGVGELRVGRRQEMLDIANYGHMIRSANQNAKRKASPGEWGHHQAGLYRGAGEDRQSQLGSSSRARRRRAGSIGGLEEAGRVRGSVYFDEEGVDAMGRVLDENPLTDLDDDYTSDAASLSSYNRVNHDYIPGVGDISTTAAPAKSTATPNLALEELDATPRVEDRSTTPTPMSHSRSGNYPPSRIPGPSRPRKSSETRAGTPSTLNASTRTVNASTSTSSTSKIPSPPLVTPTSSGMRSVSGQSVSASHSGSSAKKGASPATPTKRRAPVKSLRGKQTPVTLPKKENRQSVGKYPSPGDDEDMADAIPTWTQPVPRTGNWDEVVLPVVARNKGLDGHYETADGSPQPKKVADPIAPAPGTFGFNHAKYRPTPSGDEFIPMDEFGRPDQVINEEKPQESNQEPQSNWPPQDSYNKHEQTRLPARGTPPPSPPPFAHYAPGKQENGAVPIDPMSIVPDNRRRPDERVREEDSAGCCKCSIM